MQTREYRTTDKSDWINGPWQNEPDKKQWQDEATGLPCLAVRGPGGHWCGYVGIPDTHPWHGKGYGECVWPERHEDHEGDDYHFNCTPGGIVDAHGGLTYADKCNPNAEGEVHGICHRPEPGEPDNVWWFGFDCAHFGDLSPKYGLGRSFGEPETYRDLAYVERECADLARQLHAAA